MRMVDLAEVQTHLPDLLHDAAEGEQFSVMQGGRQLARIVKDSAPPEEHLLQSAKPIRRLGALQGVFTVPDDFDTFMQDEIEEMFYGKE